jgi:DNA-binding MarR family transcriptional regulator
MSTSKQCPSCHQKVPEGAFQCPNCELLLEGFASELDMKPSRVGVVRALFERPQAASARTEKPVARTSTHERPRTSPPPEPDDVPQVVEGLELERMRLSELEAMAVSACDGGATVEDLAEALRVPLERMQRVLQGLVGLGVVTIAEREITEVVPMPEAIGEAVGEESLGEEQTRKLDVAALQHKAEEQRHKYEERRRTSQRVARAEPPPTPETQNALQQAVRMERNGHGLEALRYLEMAISRSKDPAPLYNRLAIVLIRERLDFNRAEKMLLRALELAPGHSIYTANLEQVRHRRAISTEPHLAPMRRPR